jgi:hypothetical protein
VDDKKLYILSLSRARATLTPVILSDWVLTKSSLLHSNMRTGQDLPTH